MSNNEGLEIETEVIDDKWTYIVLYCANYLSNTEY